MKQKTHGFLAERIDSNHQPGSSVGESKTARSTLQYNPRNCEDEIGFRGQEAKSVANGDSWSHIGDLREVSRLNQ